MKEVKNKDYIIIFDLSHPNNKTPWDYELLQRFGLLTSSKSVFGPIAEKLRKSQFVN